MRTQGCLSGDDEVSMAKEYLDKGGTGVEACIQEKQIAFFEVLDEFDNELMFGSACLGIDEAQGCAADQVKQATKLDSNRP